MEDLVWLLILQNRVAPDSLLKVGQDRNGVGTYYVSANQASVRPYGICLKPAED